MRKLGTMGDGAAPAVRRALGSAFVGVMLGMSFACGPAGAGGSGGNNNPRCTTFCGARQAKGCAGDQSTCLVLCNVDYTVAASQGSCMQAYSALADCNNDPAILDLGCAPPSSKTEAFCKAQSDAFSACTKQRDGN